MDDQRTENAGAATATPEQSTAETVETGEDTATATPAQTEQTDQPVIQKGGLKVTLPKPRSRFQQRIGELVGERDRAAQENRELRERLSRLESGGNGAMRGRQPAAAAAVDPTATPTLNPEDFDTYGQYVEALVKQTLALNAKEQESKAGETAVLQHRQSRLDAFNEAAAPLIEQHGEAFMEAITSPDLPITEAMADAVLELEEIGPFVMLYLASHPTEALKMSRMNPRAATVAIGRLASRLDYEIRQGGDGATVAAGEGTAGASEGGVPAASTQPTKPAPTAIPAPRGGSPAQLDATPSDKMDTRTWMLAEAERLRKKYGPNTRTWVPK